MEKNISIQKINVYPKSIPIQSKISTQKKNSSNVCKIRTQQIDVSKIRTQTEKSDHVSPLTRSGGDWVVGSCAVWVAVVA